MLIHQHRHVGFTLIEVMVSIAVMVILVMMAAPSLATYSENSKVRGIAESFYASAQVARAEAIRTNQAVELVLTTDSPTAANVATSNLSATAGSWLVRKVSDDPTPVYTFVEGKNVKEGSGSSSGSTTVSVNALSNGVATSSIIFNSAGNTSLGARWDVDFKSTGASCAPAGPIRCLRVRVSVSGQIKACDPAATAANDTRAC